MPIWRSTPRRPGSAAAMFSSSANASSFFPCCIKRVACSKLPSRGADDAADGAELCFDASCRGCDCACRAAQAVNTPASKQRKWTRSTIISNFSAVTRPRLEHKKRGACQQAPRWGGRASSSLLESESQTELQLTHGRVAVDVCDLPGIATGAASISVDASLSRIFHIDVAPSRTTVTRRSENEFQCELQSAHHHWVIARMQDIQNLPVITAAIDARTPRSFIVLIAEIEDWVVEEIVDVRTELRSHAFRDPEIFG